MNRPGFRTLFVINCLFLILVVSIATAQSKGRFYFEARGDVVWDVPTDQKVIALTFDDGPNPRYTPQILDLLKQHHAKATFFVTGLRVQKYPELAKREVLEGHELGNHTYSHPSMRQISSEKLQDELTKANQVINHVTGQQTHLFRPPGGHYDETIVNTAKQAGYMVVMWSWDQDTRDWGRPGAEKIVRTVLSNIHNGDIVLFHDHGGNRNQTIAALREILPELQQRGYRFVTISELLHMKETTKPSENRR
ncbi:polysaccharide deacetylase family protein [Effusibacillus pohliae]|uniref:polysaccharide deacetylase family protein n=1 Tax=Effusibacillus pohliae TaxID=232270 RepID=UPI00037223AC|nr:polysaccharide deacetylase family protein [Effusibacillus pohliae]